jgi:hypothetical protein
MEDPRNASMLEMTAAVKEKCARTPLEDSDLLLLAYEEISRTTSYEEKEYLTDRPCTK